MIDESVAVEVQAPVKKPRGRPRTKVASRAPEVVVAEPRVTTPDMEFKPGQWVEASQRLPPGWQKVPIEGGTYQAWPTAEHFKGRQVGVDERGKVLKALDKEYREIGPNPAFPQRPKPTRLSVNRAFRKLFRNVQSWGEVPINRVDDSQFAGPKWQPQFRFEFDVEDGEDDLDDE